MFISIKPRLHRFIRVSPFLLGRGAHRTATRRVPPVRSVATQRFALPRYQDYIPVSDRRTFHPEGDYRPITSIYGTRVRVQPMARPSEARAGATVVPSALGFVDPARVLICVRRKTRKRVLHALGIAGGTGFKIPKFNWTSGISCKG